MPDGATQHLNPAWLTRLACDAPADGSGLTARDMALVVEVACRLAACTPYDGGRESEVEADLREHAAGGRPSVWRDIALDHSELRSGFGFRTSREIGVATARLARATMRGQRLFDAVTGGDTFTTFRLATNPSIVESHVAFARKRASMLPKSRELYPFPDRVYAAVRPRLMAGWTSSASVPIASRLIAWLTTPCRDGLRAGRYVLGVTTGLELDMAFEDVVSTLGISLSEGRRTPTRFDEILERVQDDLRTVPFSFRWSWTRSGRTADGLTLKARIPSRQEGFHTLVKARPRGVSLRGTLPRSVSYVDEAPEAEPVAYSVTRTAPPPVVGVAPVLERTPSVTSTDPVDAPVVDGIASLALEQVLERRLEDYTLDDLDAMTDEQRDALRDRELNERNPWHGVPGYEGMDAERDEPVFDDDARDVRSYWYPDLIYPITDPANPTMMLHVEKPDSPNVCARVRMTPETHAPSPDPIRCPYRHPYGMWSSVELEEAKAQWREGLFELFVTVPGESGARWCPTMERHQSAYEAARELDRQARRAYEASQPHASGAEQLRRDARELRGIDPLDDSRDDELPDHLLD